MSSIESRLLIEHYVNGGFGIFEDGQDILLGANQFDTIRELLDWLVDRK